MGDLTFRSLLLPGATATVFLWFTSAGLAQPLPGETIPPESPGTAQSIDLVPDPSEAPPPLPVIPPAPPPDPQLQVPDVDLPPLDPLITPVFWLEEVQVLGSTVLQDEIAALVSEYEQREVTFEELLELRSRITQLYIDNGYITSGAFLPTGQNVGDRVVRIQVVEGELEAIEVCMLSPGAARELLTAPGDDSSSQNPEEVQSQSPVSPRCGSAHLREGYVRSRLNLAATTPVNQSNLEEALQLLQLDPLIAQVNAELTAGQVPGQNLLRVQVQEAPAFRAGIGADNYQSPSIGSAQATLTIGHDNVFGFGDRIFAQYGRTDGLNSYGAGYAFPINAMDGTVQFRYSRDESEIVQDPFQDIGIRSESETFSLSFRQPIVRRPTTEFALGLGMDIRRSQTFILDDIPFSFSEGPDNGRSNVTAIRFSQDWVDRSTTRVLAARSQFSFGIDAFDATTNDLGIDGRFFTWLGQFQYVQQVAPNGTLFLARVDTQLSPDGLLPLEQFAIGGAGTVRGYRQNQIVTDNGILGGLEFRIPIFADDPQRLQLTPFVDAGYGWNNVLPDPEQAIVSVGLGVRWQVIPNLFVRVDYGIPLVSIPNRGNSLQENGLSLSIRYQPF
ncbi:ShlB/FhaC/HecB family hemolysin secretion/activation protein [Egbenema bharatensis]|uniref:ShlB/FhaC/HecB family hemolysin secretion/activation protein n=1 Tax=Egbenema bharatensis TaxID=3463334 RepID=UPI003A86EFA5